MPRLDSILTGLAGEGATGALRAGRSGTVYLTEGRVTFAESAHSPRLEDVLTASGRVSAAAVQRARRAASATGAPGAGNGDANGAGNGDANRAANGAATDANEDGARGRTSHRPPDGGGALIAQGVLTRGELEFCVLGLVLDAVYFLLAAAATRPRFVPGERHWLGPYWYFDVTGLLRECERRRARLNDVWPSAQLDTLPVSPVPRLPGQRVVLDALQWEVLVNADGTATPAELARRLGRPAYSVLMAVRRLAAAGLLMKPPPPRPAAGPERREPSAPEAERPAADQPAGKLPRRASAKGRPRPSGAVAPARAGAAGGGWPAVTGDPSDVSMLIRLRDALERML
ncbi:hypothetical protein HNP84_006306 [Thermocatellispora tengchongensis]|uniref:Uncharacterized protein n=1 Tax=Thermocatellispora tengchongensis TaxID=1073253 RepID=A0A840PC47_9ACTN|nr:helix-turn-helix domain-containing protein [Thermocatellispora tengchongensis]MBB5136559.1 hypothetical protein [Thermocatellispora tengchongensis]